MRGQTSAEQESHRTGRLGRMSENPSTINCPQGALVDKNYVGCSNFRMSVYYTSIKRYLRYRINTFGMEKKKAFAATPQDGSSQTTKQHRDDCFTLSHVGRLSPSNTSTRN